jgi:hypothetical protein
MNIFKKQSAKPQYFLLGSLLDLAFNHMAVLVSNTSGLKLHKLALLDLIQPLLTSLSRRK